MNIEVRNLESWEEFLSEISSLAKKRQSASSQGTHHSDLLYRGQANYGWPLSTTLERWTGANLLVRRYHRGLTAVQSEVESHIDKKWSIPQPPEFEALLEPGIEAETQFFRLLRDTQLYEYMAYLRHHGFPSPLLDWTMSPYVASYFAFANAKPNVRIAIYVYQEYAGRGKGGLAKGPRVEELGRYVTTHPRHFLQQAQYTVAIVNQGYQMQYCTHEEAFGSSRSESQDLLWKFTVPGAEREAALQYLQQHNITAYTLFGSEETLMESLAIREFTLRESTRTTPANERTTGAVNFSDVEEYCDGRRFEGDVAELEATYTALHDRIEPRCTLPPEDEEDDHLRIVPLAQALRQVLLHRAITLYEGTLNALISDNVYMMTLGMRGAFETVAALGYLHSRLTSFANGNITAEQIHQDIATQILGSRHPSLPEAMPAKQVLSMLDHADKSVSRHLYGGKPKEHAPLRDCYDFLCEFAHPNFHSNKVSYDLDKSTGQLIFRYGKRMLDDDFGTIGYLLVAAPLHIGLHDAIEDVLSAPAPVSGTE